jgi:hypothetical protein
MFDENGLGDHGSDSSRSAESEKRDDDMNKKDDEITHLGIVTKIANAMDCGAG